MLTSSVKPLICPICGGSLALFEGSYKCSRSHAFDESRDGYINLLLARKLRHGDSREMLLARRLFLNRGYYAPLSDAINAKVRRFLVDDCDLLGPKYIADIGCGEGYYIGRLAQHLSETQRTRVGYFGTDISKEAAKLVAKKYKAVRSLVVDTNRRVPFRTCSIQILLNAFAPRNPFEFHRILADNGLLLVTIPGSEHLLSLRKDLGLIEIEERKEEHIAEKLQGLLKLVSRQTIEYEMTLSGEDLANLVRMTPSNWHLVNMDWDNLKRAHNTTTQASFVVLEFRK